MSIFNSVGTPLVILMVILMVFGTIFGTAISGSDYLNPSTSNAEANQMSIETNHQQALYQESERLAKAQTDAQIQAIELERKTAEEQAQLVLNYERQHYARQLAAYETFSHALSGLISAIGILAGVALIIAIILLLGPKAIYTVRLNSLQDTHASAAAHSDSPSSNRWQSKQFRQQMIKQARENELALRQMKISQEQLPPFFSPSNMSKNQWDKLPRAE